MLWIYFKGYALSKIILNIMNSWACSHILMNFGFLLVSLILSLPPFIAQRGLPVLSLPVQTLHQRHWPRGLHWHPGSHSQFWKYKAIQIIYLSYRPLKSPVSKYMKKDSCLVSSGLRTALLTLSLGPSARFVMRPRTVSYIAHRAFLPSSCS